MKKRSLEIPLICRCDEGNF